MKNLIKVNTTAFAEEDFILMTDLSEKQIIKVLKPIVESERQGKSYYDNEKLVKELNIAFPNNVAFLFTEDSMDSISL